MKSLVKIFEDTLEPSSPFNFEKTVYNPSHFSTGMEDFEEDCFWCTFRFDEPVGVKLKNEGGIENPKIGIELYSKDNDLDCDHILKEVVFHFGMNEDIERFYERFGDDKYLKSVIERMRGARSKTKPLYETTMISIILQNATIRRSVEMMRNLLGKYSVRISFDGKELYPMWKAKNLAEVNINGLKDLKLGYRAKYIKEISQSFAVGEIKEMELRSIGKDEAKKKLKNLYGIGPASADILLFESLRFNNARDYIPLWEQKLFSKILYDEKSVERERIQRELENRYGKWKALAFWYLQTDLFWRHESEPIDWLEEEIRM